MPQREEQQGQQPEKVSLEQMRRRRQSRKGFQLTVMVCGCPGTGKSTFINTLCDGKVLEPREPDVTRMNRTIPTEIKKHRVKINELDGSVLNLTFVVTPGFGESLDNGPSLEIIKTFIDNQFDAIFSEESRVHRNPRFHDDLVHVCLYFIRPASQKICELDIMAMKMLADRVNLVPVISRSDSLTPEETSAIKLNVMSEIRRHEIPVYSFAQSSEDSDDNEDAACEAMALESMLPFALASSTDIYDLDGDYVRGREYPWGFVRLDAPEIADFTILRNVLLGSHLTEFRERTQSYLYETFRKSKLLSVAQSSHSQNQTGSTEALSSNWHSDSVRTLDPVANDSGFYDRIESEAVTPVVYDVPLVQTHPRHTTDMERMSPLGSTALLERQGLPAAASQRRGERRQWDSPPGSFPIHRSPTRGSPKLESPNRRDPKGFRKSVGFFNKYFTKDREDMPEMPPPPSLGSPPYD